MDWTEDEENALLDYLRDKGNNERFWKINAERAKAFEDCAIFLSRQSERRQHFDAEDVKKFCSYLVKDRYKLNSSNLSHLFRIGITFHREDGSCDIFTRDECRKLSEEDKAREEGRLIPEETTELPLRTLESVTRRGARYKLRSSENDDGDNSRKNARKRQKSNHTKSVDKIQPFSVPGGQESQNITASLTGGSNHLFYKHQHMDGAEIRPKFAELENNIMIAADSLSPSDKSKTSLSRMDRYGLDDFRLLKSIPITSMIQCWDSGAHFQIARALIGRAVFQWVFEDGIPDSETYGYPSKDAVEAVWAIKCEQYDMRMLNPLYAILKDAYFWQTTQANFLDVILPKRSRELSGRLSTLFGTLFKIEVPQCSVDHDDEQAPRKDCKSWSCQIEAIFSDALDLCIKLRQRDHKTVFRWPAIHDTFDPSYMEREGESIAGRHPSLKVNITYMPAVIDQRDSEDPGAVEGGVWYKAVVRLASAPETWQVPTSTSTPIQEVGL